jgi:hypothetical protein
MKTDWQAPGSSLATCRGLHRPQVCRYLRAGLCVGAAQRQADGRAVLDMDDDNGRRSLTNEAQKQTRIDAVAPGE